MRTKAAPTALEALLNAGPAPGHTPRPRRTNTRRFAGRGIDLARDRPQPNPGRRIAMKTLVTLALLAFAGTAYAQEAGTSNEKYIELLRTNVRTEKVALVTEAMEFTDAQSGVFWPIYREYEKELSKLYDERLALIKDFAANYENMTDEKAKALAKSSFTLRDKQAKLLKSYHTKVEKALSPIMAARWAQVENQIGMLIDLQIAASLPLIE
jgi:hypothetical protein